MTDRTIHFIRAALFAVMVALSCLAGWLDGMGFASLHFLVLAAMVGPRP